MTTTNEETLASDFPRVASVSSVSNAIRIRGKLIEDPRTGLHEKGKQMKCNSSHGRGGTSGGGTVWLRDCISGVASGLTVECNRLKTVPEFLTGMLSDPSFTPFRPQVTRATWKILMKQKAKTVNQRPRSAPREPPVIYFNVTGLTVTFLRTVLPWKRLRSRGWNIRYLWGTVSARFKRRFGVIHRCFFDNC